MVTMEVRVEMGVLLRQGKAIKAIARERNVSRNTVRKYVRTGAGQQATPRVGRTKNAMRLKTISVSGCAQRTRYGFQPQPCCRSCVHKAMQAS